MANNSGFVFLEGIILIAVLMILTNLFIFLNSETPNERSPLVDVQLQNEFFQARTKEEIYYQNNKSYTNKFREVKNYLKKKYDNNYQTYFKIGDDKKSYLFLVLTLNNNIIYAVGDRRMQIFNNIKKYQNRNRGQITKNQLLFEDLDWNLEKIKVKNPLLRFNGYFFGGLFILLLTYPILRYLFGLFRFGCKKEWYYG